MEFASFIQFSLGYIVISADEEHILEISLYQEYDTELPSNTLTEEGKKQIAEYLGKTRTQFDLPLLFAGTDFQNAVWREIAKIPYAEQKTYSDIAEAIGHPKAVRAVGTAVGKNPFFIVNPCHRVVSKNKMVKFAYGEVCKLYLTCLEKEDK